MGAIRDSRANQSCSARNLKETERSVVLFCRCLEDIGNRNWESGIEERALEPIYLGRAAATIESNAPTANDFAPGLRKSRAEW